MPSGWVKVTVDPTIEISGEDHQRLVPTPEPVNKGLTLSRYSTPPLLMKFKLGDTRILPSCGADPLPPLQDIVVLNIWLQHATLGHWESAAPESSQVDSAYKVSPKGS